MVRPGVKFRGFTARCRWYGNAYAIYKGAISRILKIREFTTKVPSHVRIDLYASGYDRPGANINGNRLSRLHGEALRFHHIVGAGSLKEYFRNPEKLICNIAHCPNLGLFHAI